jgi:hypothetical protein
MTIKKGKKWALSFLAVSATALVGMNTVIIVKADELSEKKLSKHRQKFPIMKSKMGAMLKRIFPITNKMNWDMQLIFISLQTRHI